MTALLVPGFGGTAEQPILQRIKKALGGDAVAVTLKKGRPGPKLEPETKELTAFWHAHGRGPIVGRSFGGRVAIRVAIAEPVPALVLLGFPIRPPGKPRPEDERVLSLVKCPTLILQGENDELGPPELLRELTAEQPNIVIEEIAKATHSYGRAESAVVARCAEWLAALSLASK